MSGYPEESADRVCRVGGIAFLVWAWLGPHVPRYPTYVIRGHGRRRCRGFTTRHDGQLHSRADRWTPCDQLSAGG